MTTTTTPAAPMTLARPSRRVAWFVDHHNPLLDTRTLGTVAHDTMADAMIVYEAAKARSAGLPDGSPQPLLVSDRLTWDGASWVGTKGRDRVTWETTCVCCHTVRLVRFPVRTGADDYDTIDRPCPVCRPWPEGFPGMSAGHGATRYWIIEPSAPGKAAAYNGNRNVRAYPDGRHAHHEDVSVGF
jgi:hypothetical protein